MRTTKRRQETETGVLTSKMSPVQCLSLDPDVIVIVLLVKGKTVLDHANNLGNSARTISVGPVLSSRSRDQQPAPQAAILNCDSKAIRSPQDPASEDFF